MKDNPRSFIKCIFSSQHKLGKNVFSPSQNRITMLCLLVFLLFQNCVNFSLKFTKKIGKTREKKEPWNPEMEEDQGNLEHCPPPLRTCCNPAMFCHPGADDADPQHRCGVAGDGVSALNGERPGHSRPRRLKVFST